MCEGVAKTVLRCLVAVKEVGGRRELFRHLENRKPELRRINPTHWAMDPIINIIGELENESDLLS